MAVAEWHRAHATLTNAVQMFGKSADREAVARETLPE